MVPERRLAGSQVVEALGDQAIGVVLREVGGDMVQSIRKPAPLFVGGGVVGELLEGALHRLPELLVSDIVAADSEDREALVEAALSLEPPQGRHQLAPCQVASGAEDDERAGAGRWQGYTARGCGGSPRLGCRVDDALDHRAVSRAPLASSAQSVWTAGASGASARR